MNPEHLQQAATLLRERAKAATPGPWRDSSTVDGVRFGALVADEPHPDRMQGGGWAWDEGYGGCLIAESLMMSDRAYIALMSPTVALALADWLDLMATDYAPYWSESYATPFVPVIERAYRVVGAILGDPS